MAKSTKRKTKAVTDAVPTIEHDSYRPSPRDLALAAGVTVATAAAVASALALWRWRRDDQARVIGTEAFGLSTATPADSPTPDDLAGRSTTMGTEPSPRVYTGRNAPDMAVDYVPSAANDALDPNGGQADIPPPLRVG